MKISEIFAKDVARPIEGVIKADDAENLETEIDEYVLSNESSKEVEKLLEEYTSYTNANGVWISGFFGSGKSHLLKMLAHLLGDVEGQEYSRDKAIDTFINKATDSFMPALLQRASRIPAKSLLFNIDQKATLISKDQNDALLKVFVKVFDENRGYYGNQGHVAKFERDLENRELYERFKAVYQRVAGLAWEQGRELSVLEETNIAASYAEVIGGNGNTPTNILAKYRDEYSVSIEDFADDVRLWLDRQESGYRLNFLVDEVGQFIGSDTRLMLNLQTIAETLNTKCKGQAWIFVTAQEDMERVIGDRTKQEGNDFSKIQARFKTRVKLTSADVEEVIRERLLKKNLEGEKALEALYAMESGNLKTLFDFADGAKTYRNYTDQHHFIGTYPLVSYQFPLFQTAISGLSDHNVFEGRNSSVGERSMLGVVQEVAKLIGDESVGTLATFDQMFAGIRQSLKSASQRAIDIAERNLDNDLANKLLKALFFVKYVDDFKATPRNLTVLIYDRFGLDLPDLSRQVQEALALLEAQTYVQRNGNEYEYLTSAEKEIEQEIKNVDLDSSEVSGRLMKLISSDIVKATKLKYEKNGQDFSFGYMLDDQPYGQQKPLTLHFISPALDYDLHAIRFQSAGKDELRVVLSDDGRLRSDLTLLLQTEKYIRLKRSSSLTATEERILSSKAAFNIERDKELVQRVKEAVSEAKLIINASDLDVKSQDAASRIAEGFQELVSRTYKQLGLLGPILYTEGQIADFANPNESTLIESGGRDYLQDAADEVFSYLTQQKKLGANVNVKSIVDHFEGRDYGWPWVAISCSLARLVATSKINLIVDGNVLKRTEVSPHLRNMQKHPHIIVSEQRHYDETRVRSFRKFCINFFDDGSVTSDALSLERYAREQFLATHLELSALYNSGRSHYPFMRKLEDPLALIDVACGHSFDWYLEEFESQRESLLGAKEHVIDPTRSFLSGPQKNIFDEAVALLARHADNLEYQVAELDTTVRDLLEDEDLLTGNRIQKLKQASDALRATVEAQVRKVQQEELDSIEKRIAELKAHYTSENVGAEVESVLNDFRRRIGREEHIASIRQIGEKFDLDAFPKLIDLVFAKPSSDPNGSAAPHVGSVSIKTINVSYSKPVLSTEEDVEEYLGVLRQQLLKEIHQGKRLTL